MLQARVASDGPDAQNKEQVQTGIKSLMLDLLLSDKAKNDSLSDSSEFARREYSNDIDDEAEMYTNNHKTASYESQHFVQSNSRLGNSNNNNIYAQQQQQHSNHHSNMLNPLSFYAKFHQQHTAPNIFVNNYLHSLLHGSNRHNQHHLAQSGTSLFSQNLSKVVGFQSSGNSHNYNLVPPTLHGNANILSASFYTPALLSTTTATSTTEAPQPTTITLSTTTTATNNLIQSNPPLPYNSVFNSYLHKPYYNQMQHYYQSFVTTPETSPNTLMTTTTTAKSTSPPSLFHYQDQTFDSNLVPELIATSNPSISTLPGSSVCGRQQASNREPRIVGGNISYEGEFPWAVSIQRHGNHHCGGVIVGRRWILTAAHCVRSQILGNLIIRTGGNTLTRSLNSLNSHLERDYLVDQIIMHDDFSRYDNLSSTHLKPSTTTTNNADIALLRLKHEIHWNELAWPVCFPNKDAGNFSGHDAIVIGWGKLNEKSEDFSNDLQKVKLTIIDNKVCQNWFRQAGREMPIDDRIICAGYKNGGKDACHGDSGGPLLSKINGQYVVVGVVSTGIGCARPLLPGLYSRVSSYISWIEKHIVE